MANKLDYDWEKAIECIEKLNASELVGPIEVDDDDPDGTVKAFLDVFIPLPDESLDKIDDVEDIIDFVNKDLPDRFFPEEGSDDSSETESADDTASEDENSEGESPEDVEPEDENADDASGVEKEGESEDVEGSGECPVFGQCDPDSDECKDCKETFADDYKACLKASGIETPKEKGKTKKEESSPKNKTKEKPKEEKQSKIEDSPKKKAETVKEEKPSRGKPKEEKPTKDQNKTKGKPKEEKPSRSKAKEEKVEEKKPVRGRKASAEESPARRKALPILTGKIVADFFRRASVGGLFSECGVDCQKDNLVIDMANKSEDLYAHVVSKFPLPHIGMIGIGDIGKIIKFCSGIGDSEIQIEITNDRFVMSSTGNKLSLLLADVDAIQTFSTDTDVNEVLESVNCSATIVPDAAKDIRNNIKFINNPRLFVEYEDEKLSITGGDSTTDRFEVVIQNPEIVGDGNANFEINGKNFAGALAMCVSSDDPIELLFNIEEDTGVIVLRQGDDVFAFSTDDEKAEEE